MGKFLKTLAKVGLVELEGGEVEAHEDIADALLAAEELSAVEAPPPKPAAPAVNITSTEPLTEEDAPFEQIYSENAVPDSPFPAEKLLKLLDGLRAMDASTRKAAVVAMDSADEQWTLADSVLDAQRKIQTLEQHVGEQQARVEAAARSAQDEKTKRDAYLEEAKQTIHQKIAELEQSLAEEVASIIEQKSRLDARVHEAEASFTREAKRCQNEIARLSEVVETFTIDRASKT